jgi:hypothetical protein
MANADQIQQKYKTAFRAMEQQGVRVEEVRPQDAKLYILAQAPSQQAKNKVWDQIKAVDPSYSDLICDIRVEGEGRPDFDQVARASSPTAIAQGLAATFKSDQTPPFGQLLGSLFGNSDPQQKAGLLNQLFAGGAAGALASEVASLFGGSRQVTPEQAAQVPPEKVQELAGRAERNDASIIDKASQFYAQHPEVVKTLGVGALTFVVSHMVGGMRGRGSSGS